jgi:micrococcal nuclease
VLLALAAAAGAGAGGVLGGGATGDREDGRLAGGLARAGAARVTRVVDGDTAILASIGRVRLIGVDTPEVHGRRECFGAQASAFAERMLEGKPVRYEVGAQVRDRYGRALVYLWLSDGRLFNELLIDGGFARPLAIAPNVRFAGRFARRAEDVRASGRGLWSQKTCPSS